MRTSRSTRFIQTLINRLTRSVNKIFSEALYLFDTHFTYLSILVIGSIRAILFFLLEYLWRYNKQDYWRWKNRALFKSIRLALVLILLKGVMQIIK